MPRYIRAQATNSGMATPRTIVMTRNGVVEPRGQQEEKAAVHGDGGGCMPGRVARVDRQALEALHVRPLALDDQRRRAIGGGLDGDDEDDEGRQYPAPHDQERHEADPDDRGDHVPSGECRSDPGDVLLRRRAIVGQPLADVLVCTEETATREEDVDQDEAEEHHGGDEQRPSDEERHDEDPNRVLRPEPLRESVGKSVGPRLEDRWDGARSVVMVATIVLRTRDRYSLHLRVHRLAFTRWLPG